MIFVASRYEIRTYLIAETNREEECSEAIAGSEDMVAFPMDISHRIREVCDLRVKNRSLKTDPEHTVCGEVWEIDELRPDMSLVYEATSGGLETAASRERRLARLAKWAK